jgi:beta-lactamase class A
VPKARSARISLVLSVSLFVAAGLVIAAGAVLAVRHHPREPARADAAQARHLPAASAAGPATRAEAGPATPAAGGSATSRAGSPARHPAGASPRPDPFSAAITSYLAGRAGVVAAAVYDLGTHQLWAIGPGTPQPEASVVKVDILETLLTQRGSGGLSGTDQALAQSMIEDSDNDSATDLWDAVGGPGGIRSFNAKAGLADTTPSPCVECAGFAWPGWGLTTTTPADQIALLRQIAVPGGLLSTPERGYAAQLMENITPSQRWGVCAGVPAQVTVALKNGWLPLNEAGTDWQINSVGWVSGLGRDYLIAVLSTGNPTERYGIDTVGWLSGAVWKQLG